MIEVTPPPLPDGVRPIEIAGPVSRVAILTVARGEWAAWLFRRLSGSGLTLELISQRRLKVEPGSPAYYARLLKRRGLGNCVDNLMLDGLREAVRAPGRLVRRLSAGRKAFPPDDGLPWIDIDAMNGEDGHALLRRLAPDLLLLAGAPILTRRTIALARVACLNPHCGITPAYAGSSPIHRALFEGRFEDIGFTVHVAVPTVDGGPVIHQERVEWDPRASSRVLWPLLAELMYEKLASIAEAVRDGRRFSAVPQAGIRVGAPAGLCVRVVAEARRMLRGRRGLVNPR